MWPRSRSCVYLWQSQANHKLFPERHRSALVSSKSVDLKSYLRSNLENSLSKWEQSLLMHFLLSFFKCVQPGSYHIIYADWVLEWPTWNDIHRLRRSKTAEIRVVQVCAHFENTDSTGHWYRITYLNQLIVNCVSLIVENKCLSLLATGAINIIIFNLFGWLRTPWWRNARRPCCGKA